MLDYEPLPKRLWIAYSGGLDSHVLLHIVSQLYHQKENLFSQIDCRTVHVHHHLNYYADDWVIHCRRVSLLLGFPYTLLYVNAHPPVGVSPEDYARQTRYTALSALLTSSTEVLLTAHHADDQAETLLLQLLRGAGPAGLAAMPTRSQLGQGWLLRPFLNYTKTQLVEYAKQHHLNWIEDSSNSETRFDRNYLRHHILPKLKTRWPNITKVFNRVAQHQAAASKLLETLAQQDLEYCHSTIAQLHLSYFSQLPVERQYNLLRYWLKQHHHIATTVQIQQILHMMLTAQADRQPLFKWAKGELRRYRDSLFVVPTLPPLPTHLELIWQLNQSVTLPLGQLIAIPVQGRGLQILMSDPLQIRFRQGGEQFYFRGHQRSVKKLLQASQIPTWQRPYLPLVYLGNKLVALPNIGICDHYKVTELHQIGYDIQWILPKTYHSLNETKSDS
jgi:tRNA(Ile)-lysidine synthase